MFGGGCRKYYCLKYKPSILWTALLGSPNSNFQSLPCYFIFNRISNLQSNLLSILSFYMRKFFDLGFCDSVFLSFFHRHFQNPNMLRKDTEYQHTLYVYICISTWYIPSSNYETSQILCFPPFPPQKGISNLWNSLPQDVVAESINVFQKGIGK